jgi:hypothetical protein
MAVYAHVAADADSIDVVSHHSADLPAAGALELIPRLVRKSDAPQRPSISRKRNRAVVLRRQVMGLAHNPKERETIEATVRGLDRVVSMAALVVAARLTHTAPGVGAALVFRLGSRSGAVGRQHGVSAGLARSILLTAEMHGSRVVEVSGNPAATMAEKLAGAWSARLGETKG